MKRLAAIAALLLLFAVAPAPSGAASTTDYENQMLTLINDARVANGLEPLRISTRLWDIAGTRSGRLASKNVLSHTAAGNLRAEIGARHLPYYGFGEAIGFTPAKRGAAAVADLFRMWKASPEHWALITSANYNYVGIGLAYRSSNQRTFGSLVFTESRDLTGGRARVVSVEPSGANVVWTWEGWDPRLQSHTAGLDDFDVQRKNDSGHWFTVLRGSSRTTWTKVKAPHGHWYSLRVRARDHLGNVGPWSSEMRIWTP
jgi:uncharacterized protein YkwD